MTHEEVQLLAKLQGVHIPAEDLDGLTGAFAAHLESLAALDQSDYADGEPIVHFDPRWT